MLCLIIQNCRTSSKSRMTSSRSKEGKCESLNGIEWMLVASVSIRPAISYVIQPNKPHFFELPECVFLLSLSRYRSIRNKGKQSPTWISISPRMYRISLREADFFILHMSFSHCYTQYALISPKTGPPREWDESDPASWWAHPSGAWTFARIQESHSFDPSQLQHHYTKRNANIVKWWNGKRGDRKEWYQRCHQIALHSSTIGTMKRVTPFLSIQHRIRTRRTPFCRNAGRRRTR